MTVKKLLPIIIVVGVGLAAVYGVYQFRANRLTAAHLEDIGEAQERLARAESTEEPQGEQTSAPQSRQPEEKTNTPEGTAKTDTPSAGEKQDSDSGLDTAALEKKYPPKVVIVSNESMPQETPEKFTVMFECSNGWFAVECHRDWAPNGVDRFYQLVKDKFFTDLRVFRVVPGFVAQFGISGDPSVSQKWAEANIPDDPVVQSNIEGTLTFAAASAPNTRSTQLFINLADNSDKLDHLGFAPIGVIMYGREVPKSFNARYGETPATLQGEILAKGNAFLDERFPGLDTIKRVVFIEDIQDQNVLLAKYRKEVLDALANRHNLLATPMRAPDRFKVRIESTRGIIVLECHRDWAPNGADRFYTLLKNKFYDGAPFFRVVPGFVVQFGLPADPKSFRAWLRVAIPDDPVVKSNTKGTIAFAAAGPNSRTTQVFFNLDDNASNLDHQGFAAFGEVVEGMDVVENINPEYGERVDQAKLRQYGEFYIDDYFPRMDRINRAFVEEEHWDNPETATSPANTPAPTGSAVSSQ